MIDKRAFRTILTPSTGLLGLLLRAVVLVLSSMATSAFGQVLTHGELLGRPTDQGVTIQAIFADTAEVRAQYGTSSGSYTFQTPWQLVPAGEPAEVVLSGLQADTRYYYRMRHRVPGMTVVTDRPEHTFHTQRAPSSTFSFVVQADPHLDEQSDTALYRLCLNNQLEDAPDFMIDLGDFLMTDKLKNTDPVTPFVPRDTISYRCGLLRSYYETGCHSIPLFMTLGNHEGEAGWNLDGTPNNIAIWDTEDRKKYFPNPAPDGFYSGDTVNHPFVGRRENYYAWSWGDAQFIVLDPYWYTPNKPDSLHGWYWTLGETQYAWLKTTLESSTATFKFVFAHQLVGGDPDGRGGVEFADRYEWGGQNLDGTTGFSTNRPGWYKPIKDLLTEHQVNIFFHGHYHFFGKQQLDCLIYQETPQPSHPNFQNAGQAADYGYFQGQILPNSGHLRVTVGPTGVQVEYVRAYLPQNENATRHNKDVSATYFIGPVNCYDSLGTGAPVLWNSDYADELVYPNPFDQEARIEFTARSAERLSLVILDANGRTVRSLIAGSLLRPGRYQVIWDGCDGQGTRLPDGPYWYSLRGEHGLVASGAMVLHGE